MDGEIPNAPNVVRSSKGKKGLLFEILFVILVLVLVFGSLNYFNILSLSNLWPNQFGFLPRRDVPTGTSQQSKQFNNVTPILRTKLSCPSVKEFCEKGEDIIKDAYVGIGYKLSSGSAIFAAFDGTLSATTSSFPKEKDGKIVQRTFIIAYLDNQDFNLRAAYYFRGSMDKNGKVKKGEQIATSNGDKITIYDNNSLIFSLIPGYPAVINNTPAILNKENFE